MGIHSTNSERKVSPDELTEGFERLGVRGGDQVMLHASLGSFGNVDGGAAMVIHRLLTAIGKKGTLMMPTFTYATTHGNYHEDAEGNHTKPGCWCEGREGRHIPFIPELQPDKRIGEIAHRLCSWPSSSRSRHPSYSFVAVGKNCHQVIHEHPLMDPLVPIKKMIEYNPYVLMIGVDFDSVTAIHLAEEYTTPSKIGTQRALTVTSKGRAWVDVPELGCSKGFMRIRPHLPQPHLRETSIGLAHAEIHSMNSLVDCAETLLGGDPMALSCGNSACLSCILAAKRP